MAFKTASKNGLTVKAYAGDAKTLIAWNFDDKSSAKDLAGFTIQCDPANGPPFYLQNKLQFETPGNHAQVSKEPVTSSINAPIHKFRWLHVPGSMSQGVKPDFGNYKYTVTPRYFEDGSLLPIDRNLSVSVTIAVGPFKQKKLALGFTRGFTQSQAFVRHFGLKALIRPKTKDLVYDTSEVSGTNPEGDEYTFADEYEWLGFTARERIFEVLNDVVAKKSLRLDVFAYDLNEPDVVGILLKLAEQGRVRVILDNATLHHDAGGAKPEDKFEKLFKKAMKKKGAKNAAAILRGKFGRFAHDKIFVVYDKTGPLRVLTGSTNFSVTGVYVNSNHVLVFDDRDVAKTYAELFDVAVHGKVALGAFKKSTLSKDVFSPKSKQVPPTEITFSPHDEDFATDVLDKLVARIGKEQEPKFTGKSIGNVFFAVMEMGKGTGPVFPTLNKLHADETIFSYGITDTTNGIRLYKPSSKQGVLVTGKPGKSQLPPPFDQVPAVGLGHQVHHKFVVCGFNGKDPVVYCGSSNLALMGEQKNGDNLITIHDEDVATVFTLEAIALVDHFEFLDRVAAKTKSKTKTKKKTIKPKFASKQQEAVSAGWFLSTSGKWGKPYFDPKDLHAMDRELFC